MNNTMTHGRNGFTPARRASSVIERSSKALLPEDLFARSLYLEAKRSDRSKRPFCLVLVESEWLTAGEQGSKRSNDLITALLLTTRSTDTTGWYRSETSIGIILTETGLAESELSEKVTSRIRKGLMAILSDSDLHRVKISVHSNTALEAGQVVGTAAASLAHRDSPAANVFVANLADGHGVA